MLAMSNDRHHDGAGRRPRKGGGMEKLAIARRDLAGGAAWELVHPRCSRKRKEDIEEVEAMVEAGETEIAHDELVWLLSECPNFLEAHVQLGLIALEDDDAKLARGHFGRAYELVIRALEAAGSPQPLPYELAGNKPFFQAAKGLVHSLMELGRKQAARDVCLRLAALDPSDPLGIQRIAQALKPGGRVVIWSSGADKMFESRLSNGGFKVQALPVRKHATAKSTSYMIYIADKIVPPAPKVVAETERPVEGGGKS
jgi:hypothetical protein